ncbi:MAG: aspartyl-trna synthetase [Pelagibacteraceae bacterium]|nr:aspartyl-trna synthetase [Pelagibacteraceae bacterium]
MKFIFIIILIMYFSKSFANNLGSVTGLKMPRYVSLKSDNVNLRVGPSLNYPIRLNYITKNLPVEIHDEYDLWRKIIDSKGNSGWIHKKLLKGDRYGLITNEDLNSNIYLYPNGKKIATIGNRNIVKIHKCLKNWCLIELKNLQGWIKKNDLWGVYQDEILNITFIQPIFNSYWKVLEIVRLFFDNFAKK